MAPETGRAGVVKVPDDAAATPGDKLAYIVLDDILYNIVFDLVLKVHREEKMARQATAAIRVEKLACDSSDGTHGDARPDVKVETDAAVYDEGKVTLKGNPLKTTRDVLCPTCHLPRLLYPTDGKGARKPDQGVIYCKKHPYMEKAEHDIYGQRWLPHGPGRGKKKKELEKQADAADAALVTSGGKTSASRPPNIMAFPSATCSKCKRCLLVSRLNNHMASCIGNAGRNATRNAKVVSNGSDNVDPADGTPPGSQKGTPAPGSSRNGSPKRRDGGDGYDDDDDDNSDREVAAPKRKKLKLVHAPNPPKKVIIKAKTGSSNLAGTRKDNKVKTGSLLSVEQKADDEDGADGTVEVALKRRISKTASPAKRLKVILPTKPPGSQATSKNNSKTASANGAGGAADDHDDDDSESESGSSGTLSSPPPGGA